MTRAPATDLRDHVHAAFAGRADSLPAVGPDARARIVTLDDAARLTAWRNEHRQWFFTQFEATPARTRAWLARDVIGRADRVLFILERDTDALPFGHLGLTNADLPGRCVEVDNMLRGVPGVCPGAMDRAARGLFAWCFETLGFESIVGRLFADNTRSLDHHLDIGFEVVGTQPLRRVEHADEVHWSPVKASDDDGPAERDMLEIRLTRDSWSRRAADAAAR